jgi:hypothetical protein
MVGYAIALLGLVAMFVCAVALLTLTVELPELHRYVVGGGTGVLVYQLGNWLMLRKAKTDPKEPEASC